MGDFDSKFMQDDELRSLLRQWSAPGAPNSLDNRIAATYQLVMEEPAALNSAFHSQRDSEVVAMKFCSTCQEQFADRFSFCPVDGTPLSAIPVAPPPAAAKPADIETSYPMSETVSAAANQRAATPPPKITVPTAAVAATAGAGHGMIGEYHL